MRFDHLLKIGIRWIDNFLFHSIDPPDERITYVALKFQMMVNSLRIFFPVSLLFMSLVCD